MYDYEKLYFKSRSKTAQNPSLSTPQALEQAGTGATPRSPSSVSAVRVRLPIQVTEDDGAVLVFEESLETGVPALSGTCIGGTLAPRVA